MAKCKLVDGIKDKLNNKEATERIQSFNLVNAQRPSFRRDANTLPRLLNILTLYPERLLSSRNAASWPELQNGTTYARNPIWQDVANQFNDTTFNNGGLVCEHEVFTDFNILDQRGS